MNYGGTGATTGLYDNPVSSTNVLTKIDQSFGARGLVSARYSRYDVTPIIRAVPAVSSRRAPPPVADSNDQVFAVNNTLVLSTNTMLETRAQFLTSDLQAPPTDRIGPAVSIAGVASFGTSFSSPTTRTTQLFQIVNNLSHQMGAHAVRVGVDVLYNDSVILHRARRAGVMCSPRSQTFLTAPTTTRVSRKRSVPPR